jgi:hypothetical protein
MTNSTNPVRGNEVAMYDRSEKGDLSLIGFFPTGDLSDNKPQLGSGPAPTAQVFKIASGGALPLVAANLDGLGSSHSLILSRDHQCLFAVNAGSNSLSSFRVQRDGLSLASVTDSGGIFPVSLTIHQNILFALNSGEQGSIVGFRVSDYDCTLVPLGQLGMASLQGYTDTFIPPAPGEVLTSPAQISFSPDGALLVVSIKGGDANIANGTLIALPSGRVVVFPCQRPGRLRRRCGNAIQLRQWRRGTVQLCFLRPAYDHHRQCEHKHCRRVLDQLQRPADTDRHTYLDFAFC